MATKMHLRRYLVTCGLLAASMLVSHLAAAQSSTGRTQIVFLGTGTSRPDPERSAPATAIVVNGSPYLVDFGPGVVRPPPSTKVSKASPSRSWTSLSSLICIRTTQPATLT